MAEDWRERVARQLDEPFDDAARTGAKDPPPVRPGQTYVYVDFLAQIKLDRVQVEQAGGDLVTAVQAEIGHTGALVLEIDAEEERDD